MVCNILHAEKRKRNVSCEGENLYGCVKLRKYLGIECEGKQIFISVTKSSLVSIYGTYKHL